MQLTQNPNTGDYSIQSYTPGNIHINGMCYTRSIILSPRTIITDWPPQTVQEMENQYIDAIIELDPEIVLLGTGEQQHFLDPTLFTQLMNKQIGFEVMHTQAACYTFNLLASEGRRVVAGLML